MFIMSMYGCMSIRVAVYNIPLYLYMYVCIYVSMSVYVGPIGATGPRGAMVKWWD